MKIFSNFRKTGGKKGNVTVRRRPGGTTLAARMSAGRGGAARGAAKKQRGKRALFSSLALPASDLRTVFLKLALGVGGLALLLAVAVGATELRAFYRNAAYWQVANVVFTGQQRLPETLLRDTYEHFLKANSLPTRPRAFDVDLERLRQFFLAQLTGLAEVTVTRQLPDGIRFTVTERVPVALVRLSGQISYQIDRNGVVFALANPEDCRYPVLTGLDASQLVIGQANAQPTVAAALALLAAIDPGWYPRIAEINATNPADLVVWVDGHKVLLGDEGFREKFTTLNDLLPQVAGRRVEYINLRSALRPAVKPLGSGSAPANQQPAASGGR